MRTAMQELLGLVEQMFNNAKTIEVESAMNDVINIITQQALEKEKEQIEQTFDNGVYHARYFREGEQQFDGEDYYNQTYNQNKS